MADEARGLARLGRKPKEADPAPGRVHDNYDDDPRTSWAAKLDTFAPAVSAAVAAVEEPAAPTQPKAPTLDDSLIDLIDFEGALGVALVDSDSGLILGRAGAGLNMELAAAGASVMLKARRATIKTLGLTDQIDDLLITLTSQLQIIRPLANKPALFIYLVVDREKSSLAMARFKATEADTKIVL